MTNRFSLFFAKQRQAITRFIFWTAGFIALWAVLAGLVLPQVVRHVTQSRLSEMLGSACTLEKVQFNPFTLRLTASHLRIPLPDGGDCFSLEQLQVRLSPSGIYRLAPVLSDLKLTKPNLEVVLQTDGTLSLASLAPASKPEPTRKTTPSEAPATDNVEPGDRFFGLVISDLEIVGGRLHFQDNIRQTEHTISSLEFFTPFTSTLQRHREQAITPYLQAVVNGRPLRIEGRLKPFAEQLHTEFDIRLDRLELARFQPYLKPFADITLENGVLSTDLVFNMRQHAETGIRLGLTGKLMASDLALLAPDGAPALRLPGLSIALDGALNTDEGLTLKKVTAQHPELQVTRLADGRIDWATWWKKPPEPEEQDDTPLPLHVELFEVKNGRVLWRDRKIRGGFQTLAEELAITVANLRLPGSEPARLQAALRLGDASLSLDGALLPKPLQGSLRMELADLALAQFQPYAAASGIPVTLQQGKLTCSGLLETDADAFIFKQGTVGLQGLALQRNDTRKTFFRMEDLILEGLTVSAAAHRIEARQLTLRAPSLQLRRDRKGIIDLQQLRPATHRDAPARTPEGPERPWQLLLAELKLEEGQVAVGLEGPKETATAELRNLSARITGYVSAAATPLNVSLAGRDRQGGTLVIDGTALLKPLELKLRMRTSSLDLRPMSPLLGALNPDLRLGAGTLTADLRTDLKSAAGKNRSRTTGQVRLESVSLLEGKRQFAALRRLQLPGLDIQPAQQRYSIGKVSLTRPHINLVVDSNGANNLARLFGGHPPAGQAPATKPKKPSAAKPPYLRIAGIEIADATLRMHDNRYKPALTNQLEKLNVTVGAMDSSPDSRSPLTFAGKLDGAPVKGEGSMNLLRAADAMELQTSLRTLNLTPLSPLSERFIAYPLQQGTFTLDSRIAIDQGKLDSTHKIHLDSLELGKKVDSPDAPDLPVKLGVSLLQDPAGNINLTLPVRGDLHDPSFSVGGLIFKVIANLLMKAVTSPFALLGGILGAGDEGLEYIPFSPGEGRLLAKDAQAVPTIAEMLLARPKIGLVLTPHADEEDRKMLADAYVMRRMQELKHADLPKSEQQRLEPLDLAVGPETDADEYADLLFEVYAEQAFDKPKNFLGLVKKLPPQEMMERIREHYPNDDKALEQLALERGRQVQRAFIETRPELQGRVTVAPPRVPGEGHHVSFGVQ